MSKRVIKKLVKISRNIAKAGLIVAQGGNISCRDGNSIFISRAGNCFFNAKEKDFVKLSLKKPSFKDASCEIHLHLGCYRRRKDIKAVIHTHCPFATALASSGVRIKPVTPDFLEMIGKGELPVIKYLEPGTKELALAVTKKVVRHNAVLLKNHGLITVGSSLDEAFYRTLLVEETAKIITIGKLVGKLSFL